MKVSRKVMGVEYAIRDIVSASASLEAAGRKITYLNIGDPVQFGFQPPPNVREAVARAVMDGHNYYGHSEGMPELREAIAAKEAAKGADVGAEDILVTNGISEALDMVMSSIVEEGDEVLLPGPYYPPYASYVRLHGGVPVEFATDAQSSEPDIEDILAKITPRTVAICVINPNNPTGTVFGARQLRRIVEIAAERGLYVVCDEIYDQITYDGAFAGIGGVAADAPVIILNGFSKVHLMTGLRLGYIAFTRSPRLESIREHLPKLARVRIAPNLPAQHGALESLRGPQSYIADFVAELKKRRDLVVSRLDSMEGLSCALPRGAFYAFPRIETGAHPDDREFVLGLLREKGVLAVHGSGFGAAYGSGHFRIVFLPPPDVLAPAMDAIEDFVS